VTRIRHRITTFNRFKRSRPNKSFLSDQDWDWIPQREWHVITSPRHGQQ